MEARHLRPSAPIALVYDVYDLVRAWIDDANLIVDDEVAVVAVVREEFDNFAGHR
jgi:hypothetical protein